jgi:hypothetical protein
MFFRNRHRVEPVPLRGRTIATVSVASHEGQLVGVRLGFEDDGPPVWISANEGDVPGWDEPYIVLGTRAP